LPRSARTSRWTESSRIPTNGDTTFAGWFNGLDGQDGQALAKVRQGVDGCGAADGRRTSDWYIELGWPSHTGDWAEQLTRLPKYMVSPTRTEFEWANVTALVDEVARMRDTVDGSIVVNGSGRLVHTLLANGLVDELRLMMCPFVVGDGGRVFGPGDHVLAMSLVNTRMVGAGLVQLTYHLAQARSGPTRDVSHRSPDWVKQLHLSDRYGRGSCACTGK
jgi:dihydrofolate reductase